MYGFHSAFTICPAFPERDSHSFISFYFYTLTRKRRLESRLFLVYRLMNVLQWPQACYGSSGLPVNREGAEYHEYF